MRTRLAASFIAVAALLGSGLPAAASANAATRAELQPRAATAGTPAEILRTVPAVAPLRVGYKRGSFPVQSPTAKDKRGCTLRNQLLIKTAVKRPKIGKGCKLTGGMWSLDFGARTETNPAKVRVTRLVPDVYVYGQGGYMWTPQARAAYSTYIAPNKATRFGYRVMASEITPSSWAVTSLSGDQYLKKIYNQLVLTSTPSQADLDALKKLNPVLFEGWTLSTLLNAKAWGVSFSPTVYANFSVTIAACSEGSEKNNPCTASYSVPNSGVSYDVPQLPAAVNEISAVAPVVPEIIAGYNQAPYGDVTSRSLFGIHAPAHWTYDEATKVDGPVDPATIPTVPYGYVRLWDTDTMWKDLEPSKGQFVWRKLAKQIQVAQAKDAHVMMVLGGTPGWANGGGGMNNPPTNIQDWRDYVHAVACQFGRSISSYEIWNEANLQTFWTGSPALMADLTKAAYEEINACAPGTLVVAANTTSRADGAFGNFFPAYLQELKARGWPVNAYSVHSYPKAAGGNGDRIAGISQFRTMLALAGAPFTTVFDTEVNYGMEGLGQGKQAIVGADAGSLLSRTYIDSVRYGFGSTFWFVWTPEDDPKMGIQLIPGAVSEQQAWNKTYEWLVGAQFHACGEVPEPQGLVVCQFDRGGVPFSIAWFGEVRSGANATLSPGFFNALGSKCDTLYSQDCGGILRGEQPITSMPVRIFGEALAATDVPERMVVRPQPGTARVDGPTEYTISVATGANKFLSGQVLNLTASGSVAFDNGATTLDATTAANGIATFNVYGTGTSGDGSIDVQSIGNPALKTTIKVAVDRTPKITIARNYRDPIDVDTYHVEGKVKGGGTNDRAQLIRKAHGLIYRYGQPVELSPSGEFSITSVQRRLFTQYSIRVTDSRGAVFDSEPFALSRRPEA